MMCSIINENTFSALDLEMDVEVKSELESDDETVNCSVSVTSSVEEVYKTEDAAGSDEELEDEPLIEIESVMVPQELVKDEMDPNILLYVKNDPEDSTSIRNTAFSDFVRPTVSQNDKCVQTDSGTVLSLTKVLRSVKTKRRNCAQSTSIRNFKNLKSIPKISKKLICQKNSKKSFPNRCSSDVTPRVCQELPKRSLKSFRKKIEVAGKVGGKKQHLTNTRKNFKLGYSSEETTRLNNPLEQDGPTNTLSNEIFSSKSCLRDEIDKEVYNSLDKPKGKENTQCNNEDEDTADSTFSVDNFIKSNECLKVMPKASSYDCTVCGKQFREKSHLATHARAHSNVRNFKCNECGQMFKTKSNLYYHTKTHEAPFICSKCNKTFQQKKNFTRHMRTVHSGEGLHNCYICTRSFKSAQNLELHLTLHTGNKPFSCDICRKTFVYKSTYRAHMKAHEADNQFDCEVCLASGTQDKAELRRRCLHYSQTRPWLCTVCGKSYPLKFTLKCHMKSHETEKPFKCEECGKCFMKKQSFDTHMMKAHTGEKPQFMCDQCSQSYFSHVALKRHYVKHTSGKKFVCDLCSKPFWTKDAMKVHRRSHDNLKTFQCTQCNKAFAHKHTLVAHARTHTGEFMHTCDICCKSFIHRYRLTRHLRQHSTPFPPPAIPLTPSLYMIPAHNHLDMPTLQIL